jgi:hypothetical protein
VQIVRASYSAQGTPVHCLETICGAFLPDAQDPGTARYWVEVTRQSWLKGQLGFDPTRPVTLLDWLAPTQRWPRSCPASGRLWQPKLSLRCAVVTPR